MIVLGEYTSAWYHIGVVTVLSTRRLRVRCRTIVRSGECTMCVRGVRTCSACLYGNVGARGELTLNFRGRRQHGAGQTVQLAAHRLRRHAQLLREDDAVCTVSAPNVRAWPMGYDEPTCGHFLSLDRGGQVGPRLRCSPGRSGGPVRVSIASGQKGDVLQMRVPVADKGVEQRPAQ